jgi:hypothetical protein
MIYNEWQDYRRACRVVVTIINERRGKSPYKRRAKQEDETLITGDNVSTEGIGKWPARPGTRLLK